MPLILSIDTATEHASICLSRDESILGLIEGTEQKNHASFVQPAIKELTTGLGLGLKDIDAVAVTAGPGSYTGLRVGMASAKGICYALQKKLILVNTLEVMAQAMINDPANQPIHPSTLLCPLIDARRMEVFTALYDISLKEIESPHAMILDASSFAALLAANPIIFAGSGHHKLKTLVEQPNARFSFTQHSAADLAARAFTAYVSNHFSDLAYTEPRYVKEFFDATGKRPT
jgi:tRNA threonylcarbamoyladenosine biosynthesis protein TsaB